jgi:hypothetical protein
LVESSGGRFNSGECYNIRVKTALLGVVVKTSFKATISWAILVILVTACTSLLFHAVPTPVPSIVEPGLVYGEPCRPPCWRGMIPGQTTRQEAEHAIEHLRSSGWANRIDGGGSGGYVIMPSTSPYVGTILVAFENEVVNRISGEISFDYSVEQMLEQFGEPEWLYVVTGSPQKRTCVEWQPVAKGSLPSSPVHMYYPQQGLWFQVLVPENGLGLICPEMLATGFVYYSPRSISEALNDEDVVTTTAGEQDLEKWHGFGGGYGVKGSR